MDELAFTIRSIDRDHNGYVTWNEMEDILKILYPEELRGKNLKQVLKPFCSSLNKVLLDYKYFKGFIRSAIRGGDVPEAEQNPLLTDNR